MHKLDRIPARIQGKIFEKLFGEAELANLKPKDMMAYEESLKVYRDLKAVTDTAYEDGYKEAESEYSAKFQEEKRQKEAAIVLLFSSGVSVQKIAEQLNLPMEYIERLLKM